MSSIDYINTLAARGIELWAEHGKLQYRAPKELITPALLAELKQHKAALLPLLEQFAGTAGSAPLSYAQKSLWSLHQLNPDSAAYNVTYAARLVDTLDIDALQRCVDYLIARHPILRTRYAVVEGQPVQQVQTAHSARLEIVQAATTSPEALQDWVAHEANQPFDLNAAPIRLKLWVHERGPRHVLLLNVHHIAADFHSLQLLVQELRSLYTLARAGQPLKLPPLPLHYKDCVQQEAERLQTAQAQALLAFWQRELQGPPPVLSLATDHPRPALKTEHGRVHTLPFSVALSARVRECARAWQVTPYMLLLGVYQLLLWQHTGQTRLWIGAPTAGRSQPGSEAVLGHFVNTVVLACELQPQESFAHLLEHTRAMMARVLDHADVPFPWLVEKLRPARDPSRSPLFQLMYNWNQLRAPAPSATDASLFLDTVLASSTGTRGATHDLTLNLQDDGHHYAAAWTFNTGLFQLATVERFAGQYAGLVEQVLTDPQQALHSYFLTTPALRQQLLQSLAPPHEPSPTLPQRVAALATQQPQRPVWLIEDRPWHAAELLAAAVALSGRLAAAGIGASHRVAIDTPSAPEHALAVLALLLRGARLTPHADSAADAVLHGQAGLWSRCAAEQLQLQGPRTGTAVAWAPDALAAWLEGSAELLAMEATRPALLITGTPAALSCAVLLMGLAGAASQVRVPAAVSFADLADTELPMAAGAVLALPDLLVPHLRAAPLHTLLAYGEHPHALAHSPASIATQRRFLPAAALADWRPVGFASPDAEGWPWVPTRALRAVVLSPCHTLADIGQTGHLHLVNPGMELQPATVLDALVATPWPARLTEDLRIICRHPALQRLDGRSEAIELAPLEAWLAQQPEVAQVAGALRTTANGHSFVMALQLRPEATLTPLQRRFRQTFADACQPEAWLVVPQLPLDAQGQLDVQALPPAAADDTASTALSPTEQQLAALWREVLARPEVGPHDDFFALGGDSILAAVIVAKAATLGLYLRPRDLFEHPTLAELATVVSLAPHAVAEQGPIQGTAAPGPAAAWFFEQVDTDRSHFNQALLIGLHEAPETPLMQQALQAVATQHDALGARVTHDPAQGWQQHFGHHAEPAYHEVPCLNEHGQRCHQRWRDAIDRAQRALDIEHGPLWTVRWLIGPTLAESRLLIVVHHLAIDGVSWSVLLQDLSDSYQRLRAHTAAHLPAKTSSVKAWVEQWQTRVAGDTLANDRCYWQARATQMQHAVQQGQVALMRNGSHRPRRIATSPGACSLTLDRDTTRALRTQAHQAYGTDMNDLLLAAVHAGLQAWSGATALLVDVEGHGREALGTALDLSRSVGWFTAIYPVLLQAPAFDPATLIKHVKQQLREVPSQGASFGALRHLAPSDDPTRHQLAAMPEAPVLFTYLGAPEQMVPSHGLYNGTVEPTPAMRSPRQRPTHLLDMWAYITAGCLTLECSFAGGAAAEESIGCLMQRIEHALHALIQHCCSAEAGGIVPADVPSLGLDQAGLDALLDEVAALEHA